MTVKLNLFWDNSSGTPTPTPTSGGGSSGGSSGGLVRSNGNFY